MRKLLISLLILSYAGSICASITSIRKAQHTQKTPTAPLPVVTPATKTTFMAQKK
jgi:hypothetical protein